MRSFYFALAGALLVSGASPSAAEDFNWRTRQSKLLMLGALNNLGTFCSSEFGFTRLPKASDEIMSGKIEAHLLLAPSADYLVEKWAQLILDWTQLNTAGKDDALIDRVSDALVAAHKDPESRAAAEKLYVTTVMGPLKKAYNACDTGARDEFLSKHYFSGTGSLAKREAMAHKMFADGVAELAAEKQ